MVGRWAVTSCVPAEFRQSGRAAALGAGQSAVSRPVSAGLAPAARLARPEAQGPGRGPAVEPRHPAANPSRLGGTEVAPAEPSRLLQEPQVHGDLHLQRVERVRTAGQPALVPPGPTSGHQTTPAVFCPRRRPVTPGSRNHGGPDPRRRAAGGHAVTAARAAVDSPATGLAESPTLLKSPSLRRPRSPLIMSSDPRLAR